MQRHSSAAYVVPFAVFMGLLAVQAHLRWLGWVEYPIRIGILAGVLWLFSRSVIDLRSPKWISSIFLGLAVFALWVAPDILFPGYREHWLFQNRVTGALESSIPESWRSHLGVLVSRALRAVVLVPVIEELFWRAWLMRWLISPQFQEIPLGAYTPSSFWLTALLFASAHGPYWDVGFLAGIAYNWWMLRTRSLGDCILAHAVTNACLSAYVIASGNWQYWL